MYIKLPFHQMAKIELDEQFFIYKFRCLIRVIIQQFILGRTKQEG